jgi:hypothetical protein
MLKSKESRWIAIEQRLNSRADRVGSYSAQDAANLSTQISIAAGGQSRATPGKRSGPIRPGSGAGGGTALMDRPAPASQTPRPRKGKGKRKR